MQTMWGAGQANSPSRGPIEDPTLTRAQDWAKICGKMDPSNTCNRVQGTSDLYSGKREATQRWLQVSWAHTYDNKWNNVWSAMINHWNKVINIWNANQYKQDWGLLKWPDWSTIWAVNIIVWNWKPMNVMELIEWKITIEWTVLKDKSWNVLCAINDPNLAPYKNLLYRRW